jgi:hypothetical protein
MVNVKSVDTGSDPVVGPTTVNVPKEADDGGGTGPTTPLVGPYVIVRPFAPLYTSLKLEAKTPVVV